MAENDGGSGSGAGWAQGWVLIIGAAGIILTQIASMYFENQREWRKLAVERETKETLSKVLDNQDQTHETLKSAVTEQKATASAIATTAEKVEQIQQATTMPQKVEVELTTPEHK